MDANLLSQVKSLFERLETPLVLAYRTSNHPKQNELVEMLDSVASCSPLIEVQALEEDSTVPHFSLRKNDKETGVSFTGIPGGHEFSSLILAILNGDRKGKLPEEFIIQRIKNLNIKKTKKLKTFISLSCENCPDIVQTLNLFSFFHPNLSHEMIDGEFAQEEIKQLGIQGVPSVVLGEKLLHSGKSDLISLLEKLEEEFGIEEESSDALDGKDLGLFDVVVIGAGPAGVSSAIYSARKGLRTAVIADKIGGQLQDTQGIENVISIPFTTGSKLSDNLLNHLKEYEIDLFEYRRVQKVQEGQIKNIQLNTKETLQAKSLIIATGAKWRELNIPGEKEYIGKGVAFCPHCDGPYYKGKDVIVVGGGNSGIEAAIDLAGIVKSVTVLEFADKLKADQVLIDKVNSLPNTKIITQAKSLEVIGDGKKVTSLKYENRENQEIMNYPVDGIFVQIGLIPNSQFLDELVEKTSFGEIIVNEKNETSVRGVYAAGDVTTTPYKQIIISMGEGAKAALSAFEYLSF